MKVVESTIFTDPPGVFVALTLEKANEYELVTWPCGLVGATALGSGTAGD